VGQGGADGRPPAELAAGEPLRAERGARPVGGCQAGAPVAPDDAGRRRRRDAEPRVAGVLLELRLAAPGRPAGAGGRALEPRQRPPAARDREPPPLLPRAAPGRQGGSNIVQSTARPTRAGRPRRATTAGTRAACPATASPRPWSTPRHRRGRRGSRAWCGRGPRRAVGTGDARASSDRPSVRRARRALTSRARVAAWGAARNGATVTTAARTRGSHASTPPRGDRKGWDRAVDLRGFGRATAPAGGYA
jgi:hypothetical protein